MPNDELYVDFSELNSILNLEESIYSPTYNVKRENYISEHEIEAFEKMKSRLTSEESLVNFYRNVCQDNRKPDLLGKTIEATEKQFKKLYNIVDELSKILNIVRPRVFVYEDLCYRADVDGYDNPWIEVSSKLIQDFTEEELRFVIGKLLASIQSKHYEYEAVAKAFNDVTEYINMIPVVNVVNSIHLIDSYKLNLMPILNCWRRCANYSTDACGLLLSGSFKASVNAILKQILNNSVLVSEVNIKDYISKAVEIEALTGKMVEYSKLDEAVPYGQYRILELLRYSGSRRCKKALLELSRR
ncbi:hypothetical protein HMPREF1982_03094 [Clostridiales bacterium oral taxon 876 str. F0540]|nr:hypothetical protein HMPREF1982_03094 [Clostridiales bacterium oral taxon 876 str. F0540]